MRATSDGEPGLRRPVFRPLPLGRLKPAGWLRRQLRVQADGLSGHLDQLWPDLVRSQWFGGDRESWERAPYWLDGAIPLAFLLDDKDLTNRITGYVEFIVEHQHPDGWLGSRSMVTSASAAENPRYDLWAQFLALKALIQYHDATGDERIVRTVERNLRCIESIIDRTPLFNWGQFRWFESLLAIQWLFDRIGGKWLLDLAVKLAAQGFHWGEFFRRWPLERPTAKGKWTFMGHVVNNAMAVKAHGLWWRHTGAAQDRQAVYDMIAKLDQYHGMPTGVFTGDECLAGRDPAQGTELCAVVEYAYSLETLLSVLGDPVFGDRLEKIVFNAIPATFSPDMWSHQYDQQANQVECSMRQNRTWNTNGSEANIFGLEPNYGCCTANLSQGWPKFAANLWMTTEDGGLAAVAYSPCELQAEVGNPRAGKTGGGSAAKAGGGSAAKAGGGSAAKAGGGSAARMGGVEVSIRVRTDYPFSDRISMSVEPSAAVRFPLLLRIPGWAKGARVLVNGKEGSPPKPGSFHRLERQWRSPTEIEIVLPMKPRAWSGFRGAIAIERGPLVYSLKIGEEWRRAHAERPNRELPHADWEVFATTPWNYALLVKKGGLAKSLSFQEGPVGSLPFSPDGAPVRATAKARRLPGWIMEYGSAARVPEGPVRSTETLEDITLIPYGCTNLRITEFPVLDEG